MATDSTIRRRGIVAMGCMLLALGLAGCNQRRTVQGECRPVYGADLCTWGETTGNTVTAFGMTVPLAVAENAPAEVEMTWPPVTAATIPLPETVRSATGFDHVTVYWEPHGHPPGPYLTPHFDFHFNSVSSADIKAIDCADSTRPAQLPAGYELPDVEIPQLGTLVGLCVPGMGMHSLLGSELHSTALFEKTMIVGFYHGLPIFVEPMITAATLNARQNFTLDVPAIAGVSAQQHYPQAFRADYDSTAQAYRFVFSNLTGSGGS